MKINKQGKATLDALLATGVIKLVDGEYLGKANDGVEVALGYDWDSAAVYCYLADHPTPNDW